MLLFFTGTSGVVGAVAATLTLTAPAATVGAGTATVAAPPATLTLTAPPPASVLQTYSASAAVLALTAPPATILAGPITLPASDAATLALTAPAAGLTIDLTIPIIAIDGSSRTSYVRRKSLSITDVIDEGPNTCSFTAEGFTPAVGEEIVIALGTPTNKIFAGHLQSVEQSYDSKPENVVWNCSAVDYTRLLDRRVIAKKYPSQSATAIVNDILTNYTTGFTNVHVTSGLPTIEEIEFTWEAPTRALTRIAKLIGGYWYVDYDRDVHFFLTETTDAPDDITDAQLEVRALERGTDLSQIRTKVIVEGYGGSAVGEVAAGDTAIPVDDAAYYSESGGLLKTGSQRLAYTGRTLGGAATVLRGVDAPSGTPTAAITPGVGGVIGSVRYKVTLKSDAGETAPGPQSNAVTGVTPTLGGSFTAAAVAGAGKLVGSYTYGLTLVTALGETTVQINSNAVTVNAFGVPTAPSVGLASGLGVLEGALSYKVTNVNALGETTPSSAGSRTAVEFAAPASSPTAAQVSNTPGNLTHGGSGYRWAYTYVTAYGETLKGAASSAAIIASINVPGAPSTSATAGAGSLNGTYSYRITFVDAFGNTTSFGTQSSDRASGVDGMITLSSIPLGPTGIVARRIYRWKSNELSGGQRVWRYLTELGDNSTQTFDDTGIVAGAWTEPSGKIAGQVTVSNIGTGPTGTVSRRLYRTKRDGSAYFFVGDLGDNATTSFVDNVPDDSLTVPAPFQNDAGGQQHAVTVPTGPTGTLARRIYRTKAGGSQYFLLGELQDNSTTTWTDNLPDDALSGAGPPLVNTAGGGTVSLTGLLTGGSGVIARNLYRTKAGGTQKFLVTQIPDNGTTTYTDTKADDELGDGSPLANSAGGSAVALTSIPIGGSGITARRIYRTEAGGSIFYFVDEIKDNTTTTYTDTASDGELGDVAPAVSTIGALTGATSMLIESGSGWPNVGWAYVGNQLVRFTGVGATSITGIPASGVGSLASGVRTGTQVVLAHLITGIPSSGTGSIQHTIRDGDPVNILVERDDAAAQAALAAVEGGDGVHEYFVSDQRLSIASATTRADAELAQFSTAEQRLTFTSRDYKLRSGKTITVNLGAPTNVAGTFKIQQVTISNFVSGKMPWRTVTASTFLYSFEHLLRRVELGA
jgi:hypothetical protein